jgi:hypothetical protein
LPQAASAGHVNLAVYRIGSILATHIPVIQSHLITKNATSMGVLHFILEDFALSDSGFTQSNRGGFGRVPFALVLL